VNWSGVPLPTAFVSSERLTATVAASDIASAGTVSVTVVNPTPGGGTSNVAFFQVAGPTSSVQFGSAKGQTINNVFGEAVADFNGDGKLDIASGTNSGSSIVIRLGNGDGTFQGISYPTSGLGLSGVFTGDFNGDGKLDVVAAESLLPGNGDGTFQAAIHLSSLPGSIGAVGDFNKDGKLDLAGGISNNLPPIFWVALGNGDGTFQSATTIGSCGVDSIFRLATADINGDGNLDLVTFTSAGGVASFCTFLGNGDGTFTHGPSNTAGQTVVENLVLTDFNGDGKPDLVYLAPHPVIQLGQGDGTFQGQTPIPIQAPSGGCGLGPLVAGDFNGDGKLDLAMLNCVVLGNGDGTFQTPLVYPAQVTLFPLVAADFNNDGKLDLEGSGIAALQLVADFSLAASTLSQTVTPGQVADYSLTVTPIDKFNQTVSFTCGGAPTGSACTVAPASVTLDGANSSTITVSVASTAMAGMGPAGRTRSGSEYAMWTMLTGVAGLALFLPVGSGKFSRRRQGLRRLALLFAVCLGMTVWGCGGSYGSSSGGTPAGTYNLTVTGTYTAGSANLTHSVNLTLVVQ